MLSTTYLYFAQLPEVTPNKYLNWYVSLVDNAMNRPAPDGYTEKHHIIPKSMGGSNDPDNFAVLTAREHFVAHSLLPRFLTGMPRQKMIKAHVLMSGHDRYGSRAYKSLREELSEMPHFTTTMSYKIAAAERKREKERVELAAKEEMWGAYLPYEELDDPRLINFRISDKLVSDYKRVLKEQGKFMAREIKIYMAETVRTALTDGKQLDLFE